MLREIALAEATAEIERQQADIDRLMSERNGWLQEIERLREELRAVLLHVAELRAHRNEQQP